jgi:hypothetical protein
MRRTTGHMSYTATRALFRRDGPETALPPACRLLCGWCGLIMREGPEPESLGICQDCSIKQIDGQLRKP